MSKNLKLSVELKCGNQVELNSTVNPSVRLKRNRGKGFTLAEILITLTVIGVVAALTIPTLLQNTNQAELKAAWKKTYGDISQATLSIMNDNGGTVAYAFSDHNSFKNKYLEKLSYIKTCYDDTRGNCFAGGTDSIHFLNGSVYPDSWMNSTPSAILSNGTSINFYFASSDCTSTWHGIQNCGAINVDVNGLKKPNTVGKDIFALHVRKDGIVPFGSLDDVFTPLGCSTSYEGWGCSADYLYQ